MKQTKAPVSQLLGANEEIQRVIVDSCGGATELSHSVACWAKTLPRATTSRLHTKLPGCRADEGPPSPYVIRSDSLCGNTTLWNGCVPTGSRAAKLKLRVFKEFWSWDLWCYIITAVAFNALRTTAARFLHSVFVISVSHLTQKKHKNYFLKFPLLTILIQFTGACSQTNLTWICQIDGCDWANRWLKPVVFIKGPSGN